MSNVFGTSPGLNAVIQLPITTSTTASTTQLLCGSVNSFYILPASSAAVVTYALPDPTSCPGGRIHIKLSTSIAAHFPVIHASATQLFQGIQLAAGGDPVQVDCTNITLTANAEEGTSFDFVSDGSYWHTTIITPHAAADVTLA